MHPSFPIRTSELPAAPAAHAPALPPHEGARRAVFIADTPEVESVMSRALLDRIENDFKYHAPTPEKIDRFELIRTTAYKLARVLIENVPPGRELHTALTNLETAVMHANAGIARKP